MKSDVQSLDTAVEPGWRSKLWFEDAPPFKVYMRSEWKDLLITVLLLLLSIMLFIYAEPPQTHHFLLNQERYSHPLLSEFITTEVAAVVSFGVPLLVMIVCGVSLQSGYWDTHSAIKGLGFALSAANLFQLLCKLIVASPRPNFYSVCRPAPWLREATATGYGHIFHTRDICANPTSSDRELTQALTSFPSGHSVAAFAGFGYLALWINTKFADDKRSLWRLGLVFTPVTIAGMIAWSKIADYWHHPMDVVGGALIGSMFAYVVFRYQYFSVWASKETKELAV